MEVLIVGAGSMGTWFGGAVGAEVTFTDVDPDAARAAADAVDGDVTAIDDRDSYDVVCIAVPMVHVVDAIADHADRAQRAVVDLAGVMEPPLDAMATHAPNRERVSLHPLFAPDRAPGSIAVVSQESGPATDAILDALTASGNDLVETTATEHDEAMESVQAATHAAVLSFALAAESVPEGFETPIYAGLRELAETMTEGTPRVYTDIQATFDGADAVAEAATEIAAADEAELATLYREAAATWHDDRASDEQSSNADESMTIADSDGGADST